MDHSTVAASSNAESKLPPEIAATLERQKQHALDNRVRREILRLLMDDESPQSAADLTESLDCLSLSAVKYHLGVLDECGSAFIAATRVLQGVNQGLYATSVAGDEGIISALRHTQEADQQLRRRHVRHPKSPLSPRGLISICLGKGWGDRPGA